MGVAPAPWFSIYDPRDGYVYVTSTTSESVSVLNGTLSLASINVGGAPGYSGSGVYDPENGYVYLSNEATGQVDVLNGESLVEEIEVGEYPTAPAFDARNGWVYVPNLGNRTGPAHAPGYVSVIDGTRIIASVTVGINPWSALYVANSGDVYVPNYDSQNLSVISGTSLLGNISLGGSPFSSAYDPANGLVYVTGQQLWVLNGSTILLDSHIGPGLTYACVDSGNSFVYVVNNGGAPHSNRNNLSVFNGSTLVTSLSVGDYPLSCTYDDGNGYVYVPNADSANLTVADGRAESGTIEVGTYPGFSTYDPVTGGLYVPNLLSGNVSVLSTAPAPVYALRFTASGLPAGVTWSATFSWQNRSSSSGSIAFGASNGTYAYQIHPPAGYRVASPTGLVTVGGANVTLTIPFSPAEKFGVNFTQSGLPPGTTWTVALNGSAATSAGGTIGFQETNGSYPYVISPVPGYRSNGSRGTAWINGSNVELLVGFSGFTTTYAVSFAQQGLPVLTRWSVTLNGVPEATRDSSLQFDETNGSFEYEASAGPAFSAEPSNGVIGVAGGAVDLILTFHPVLSANFTTRYGAAGCLSDGGLINNVTLTATPSGGVPPYVDRWTVPTGSTQGPETNTTLRFGGNDTVRLSVSDTAGEHSDLTQVVPMELPPCPPPAPSGAAGGSAGAPPVLEIGVAAVAAALAGLAVWARWRGRRGSSAPSP